jgi:hypothetical protein
MIQNFLMGAGVKLAGGLVQGWLENSAEERRNSSLQDAEAIKAHVELAKETNRNVIMICVRGAVYICLTLTWCYMGIYGLKQEGIETSVLIPNDAGFFGSLFHHQDLKKIDIKGTTLLYQWWQIMEMIMGAFVMPSRRS